MFSPSVLLALTALAATSARAASPPSYTCAQVNLTAAVNATTTNLTVSAPANGMELADIVMALTSETSNLTAQVSAGKTNISAAYDIYQELCVPAGFPSQGGTLEFAIHGINFDHTYWTFGGNGSEYNYVEAAMEAGHAVFIYDRLGVGMSSKPDGIKEVQAATEIAIAATFIAQLRNGINGYSFQRIVGVGHSFGSIQLFGLAAEYGNVLDAIVFTGFSSYGGGMSASLAGFGVEFAAQQNSSKWGDLPNTYLATGGIMQDQLTFFDYPNFDQAVLELAEYTKATLTVGEFLTQTQPTMAPAQQYNKPVLVVTGDHDYIFCGGNCYQAINGSSNILELTKTLFPAVSNYSVYIPAGTGHAVNQHYSAPGTYQYIERWIGH